MKLRDIALLFLLILMSACGNSFADSGPLTVTQLGVNGVTFEQLQQEVFVPHCLRCHGNYSSVEAITQALPRIISRVESGSMPQGGPRLSPKLIALLKNWRPLDVTTPTALAPTWASLSVNLIGPKCMSCHNPTGQALFLDLSTRQAIFNERNRLSVDDQKLIDFDDPDASYLLVRVKDPLEPMPPLPPFSTIPQLTAAEADVLREWIARGLP